MAQSLILDKNPKRLTLLLRPTATVIRNYLVSAFRTMIRYPGFTAINVVGLSVGVAAALLIVLFVQNELGFDKHFDNADNIYRAWVLEDYGDDQRFFNTTTPIPLAAGLASEIPEIESIVRLSRYSASVGNDQKMLSETIFAADEAFFDIFKFGFSSGNVSTALASGDNIVLSAPAAERYFGEQDPIGESLLIQFPDQDRIFTVAGVVEAQPASSSINFDFLIPYAPIEAGFSERMRTTSWFNVSVETYVVLQAGTNPSDLGSKLASFVANALGDRVQPGEYTVGLQPLLDIHLNPEFPIGFAPVSNPVYTRVLSAIAALILLIACINFVTLSISRSVSRSVEVGVRKSMGASRSQLMRQYWGEALGMSFVSLLLGAALAELLLPGFNSLASASLVLNASISSATTLLVLFLVIGLLAGIYPAIILSGLEPTAIFQGKLAIKGDKSLVRKMLVLSQFALSIFLLAGTLLIGKQLDYVTDKNLGYEQDHILMLTTNVSFDDAVTVSERLRVTLAAQAGIQSISAVRHGFSPLGWTDVGYTGNDEVFRWFTANTVDEDYLTTTGIRLVSGRDFSRDISSDATRSIIVNQAFVDAYGWDDAIGKQIPGQFDEHEVIGVVQDFHFESLHTTIRPAVLALGAEVITSGASDLGSEDNGDGKILVRTSGENTVASLSALEGALKAVAPDIPFSYSFVSQQIESQYLHEFRLRQIANIGSMLALFIATLGLFGLAALATVRRTKEVCIRRVLGASTISIIGLFGRDFSQMVLAAFIIATPLTWYLVSKWLESFAYRIEPGITSFAVAGIIALAIMWVAVTFQSLRAARFNPAQALRNE